MSGIYRDKGEQAMEEERREKARRLSRYDEAVRLITERVENCSCALPGPSDLPEIIKRISNDLDNVEGYCDDCLAGVAFLVAEPKEGKVAG